MSLVEAEPEEEAREKAEACRRMGGRPIPSRRLSRVTSSPPTETHRAGCVLSRGMSTTMGGLMGRYWMVEVEALRYLVHPRSSS
jgi:hypothetical protein